MTWLDILKWTGTTAVILGAIATSLAIDPVNIILFNIGGLLWLIAAIKMNDRPLITLNAILLLIYLVGFLARFFA